MKKQVLITFILLVLTHSAFADQCTRLPKSKAKAAHKIITNFIKSNDIAVADIFCEACRDEAPKVVVLESTELKDFQVKGYKEITVNDQAVDLAYLYINGENVASMVDCKTIGVDKFL